MPLLPDPSLPEIAPLLYVPAVRPDLADILAGKRAPGICSLAICLEDAVRPDERVEAARRTAVILGELESAPRPIFIRPADLDLLNRLLDTIPGHRVAGFILPKATTVSIGEWAAALGGEMPVLPTMESRQVLDPAGRHDLVQACWQHRAIIPRVRIGANDLLRLLGGLRRPRGRTIYETPVARVIDALLEGFAGSGIPLCGTAFDRIDDIETLRREAVQDIERGLLAKTALTPAQVHCLWDALRPSAEEIEEARCLLAPDSPAVFGMNGTMLEPACHRDWAVRLLRRAELHARAGTAGLTLP